jgi:hypothetical protein
MTVEWIQARYNSITEHSQSDIRVVDAVAQALKETYPFPSAAPPVPPK